MFGDGAGTVTLIGIGAGANIPSADYLTTAIGFRALNSSTNTNSESTAVGWKSQAQITTGGYNTTLGVNSLGLCLTCVHDIAIGTDAIRNSLTAQYDIAIGAQALLDDYSAGSNIAIGDSALQGNSSWTGTNNIAIGKSAMVNTSATSATQNIAIGLGAGGAAMVDAANNVCIGFLSCNSLVHDQSTVAIGFQAGNQQNSGGRNTFIGSQAGYGVTAGVDDIVIGNVSNSNINELTTGSNVILIGDGALPPSGATISNQISIANILTATGIETPATSITVVAGVLTLPAIATSAPATHCALWANAGVINITTCP
jgi:hypothetical protein